MSARADWRTAVFLTAALVGAEVCRVDDLALFAAGEVDDYFVDRGVGRLGEGGADAAVFESIPTPRRRGAGISPGPAVVRLCF
jgi:hypothetical protein